MTELKKAWLLRIVIGGLCGMAVFWLLACLWDAVPWLGHIWTFRSPFVVLDEILYDGSVNLLFAFLLGAEAGVATLPFADQGKALVLQTLAHFAVTAATAAGAAWYNFGVRDIPLVLLPLALLYLVIWLGRWVGWYGEVADLRVRLGLAPGPSPLKWQETLPYMGFALFTCGLLPALLWWVFDAMAGSLLVCYLLLPVGCFCSGLSLGKRYGFCPLYPPVCGAVLYVVVQGIYNIAHDACLIPIVFSLAGNLAGWLYRRAAPMNRWKDLGRAVLCGGATVCWSFWLAPTLLAPGVLGVPLADWLLYPLLLLVAALIGWAALAWREPVDLRYLWVSLLTQYGLAWAFQAPFAQALGISLRGTGSFEYLLPAVLWPLAATGTQLVVLWLAKRIR